MIKHKINVGEYNKIKIKKTNIRKDLLLSGGSETKQYVTPKKGGLNVLVPSVFNTNTGFVIKNNSENFDLIVKSNDGVFNYKLEPLEENYFMFNGSNWEINTTFTQYIQIPIQLSHNFDNDLGYNDYIKETVGEQELDKVIPTMVNLEKIKFKPVYPEIKIVLWFAQYDSNGNYLNHSNVFNSVTPFDIESNYFNTSYLQLNYYTDNLVFNNTLIDYKINYFDEKWLEYNLDATQKYTSMLIQKPYEHPYNLNINNYYFYYFEELFNSENNNEITLYLNAEFKNSKTGKSQLFTSTNGGVITNTEQIVDKNKLYQKMTLRKNGSNCTYSYNGVDPANQINLFEVINV